MTGQLKVNPVAWHQTQLGANVSRDHETTLLTENQCGIHKSSMPRFDKSCHGVGLGLLYSGMLKTFMTSSP